MRLAVSKTGFGLQSRHLAQLGKDFHAHAGETNWLSCTGKVGFAGIVPL